MSCTNSIGKRNLRYSKKYVSYKIFNTLYLLLHKKCLGYNTEDIYYSDEEEEDFDEHRVDGVLKLNSDLEDNEKEGGGIHFRKSMLSKKKFVFLNFFSNRHLPFRKY